MNVSKLEIVPIRDAFPHEAHNFTRWLEANIDALSDRLGLELTVLEREKTVGSFKVDLFCESSGGTQVIIENQLEPSNHDHLGKLLTYLVNLEAKTAIWITPEVRPEHERVIDWLNESTGSVYSFFLVQVQAARIGNSPFAPLFTVLAAPDEQTQEIGETKKELADRHYHRLEFWKGLLERSKGRTQLFSGRTPGKDHWLSTGSGKSGIEFNYLIFMDGAGLDLYIDVGDSEKNKAIFQLFYDDKEAIEMDFGEALEWRRMDDKRASRIFKWVYGLGSLQETETWPTLQDAMIEAMIRFDKVFRPRINRLQL